MAKRILHTQRTLKEIKKKGFRVGIVEKFNHFAGKFGVRQDLFGFIDLVYLDTERNKIVAVQSTSQNCYGPHRDKIVKDCAEAARLWLECGGLIELWAWRKLKVKRGARKEVWKPRIEQIVLEE